MDCASCGRDIRQAEKQYETGGRLLCETCYIYHIRDRELPAAEAADSHLSSVKCPKCGTFVQEASWRCRECYFEFENYDFASHRFIGKPRVRRKKGRPDPAWQRSTNPEKMEHGLSGPPAGMDADKDG